DVRGVLLVEEEDGRLEDRRLLRPRERALLLVDLTAPAPCAVPLSPLLERLDEVGHPRIDLVEAGGRDDVEDELVGPPVIVEKHVPDLPPPVPLLGGDGLRTVSLVLVVVVLQRRVGLEELQNAAQEPGAGVRDQVEAAAELAHRQADVEIEGVPRHLGRLLAVLLEEEVPGFQKAPVPRSYR